MARTNKQIISPQQLPVIITTLYTTPTNRTTVITRLTFTNVTATDRFISVWIVPSGGSAVDSTKIIDEFVVAAGETFSSSDLEGHVLPEGETIQAVAETASTITVIGSGTEIKN